VNIFLYTGKILLEHIHLGNLDLLLHAGLLTNLVDRLKIFLFVQVRDITSVEDVVNVF